MTHAAKIIADSISPAGVRLTTFEIRFPRIILAEVNTHKMISKNSASSRAIPVKKMIDLVRTNPYVPSTWGKNRTGMQASEMVSPGVAVQAKEQWLRARDSALSNASQLAGLKIHKQLANRLLEPFLWHTAVLTATEWSNFFGLRNNPAAHPDFEIVADLMQREYEARQPDYVGYDTWHLPFIYPVDRLSPGGLDGAAPDSAKISAARCARVSYLTHDGVRDQKKDLELHDRLIEPGHLSPFEHPARPMTAEEIVLYSAKDDASTSALSSATIPFMGNLRGWVQYRKMIPGETDITAHRKAAEKKTAVADAQARQAVRR